MNRDEVMDWIDNASKTDLQTPPQQVKETLVRDRECMRYYQVSLKLKQQKQEVDLWNKFQQNLFRQDHAVRKNKEPKGLFTTKWLWKLSTAGAAAAIALLLLLYPFSWKLKSEPYTEEIAYYDSLDFTVEIIEDFGIDGQYDMGALDYYYAITTF